MTDEQQRHGALDRLAAPADVLARAEEAEAERDRLRDALARVEAAARPRDARSRRMAEQRSA